MDRNAIMSIKNMSVSGQLLKNILRFGIVFAFKEENLYIDFWDGHKGPVPTPNSVR
jgi:hypothetical protein